MLNKFYLFFLMAIIILVAGSAWCSEPFYVGPGDILEVSVWRDENLTRELVITPDGILSYPLIGDVNVESMSVAEIKKVITKKLSY